MYFLYDSSCISSQTEYFVPFVLDYTIIVDNGHNIYIKTTITLLQYGPVIRLQEESWFYTMFIASASTPWPSEIFKKIVRPSNILFPQNYLAELLIGDVLLYHSNGWFRFLYNKYWNQPISFLVTEVHTITEAGVISKKVIICINDIGIISYKFKRICLFPQNHNE